MTPPVNFLDKLKTSLTNTAGNIKDWFLDPAGETIDTLDPLNKKIAKSLGESLKKIFEYLSDVIQPVWIPIAIIAVIIIFLKWRFK